MTKAQSKVDSSRMGRRGGRPKGLPKTGGRAPGTPNKSTVEIKHLARQWGPSCIEEAARLAGLIRDDEGKQIGAAQSESARMSAICFLVERGYGKATQHIEANVTRSPRSMTDAELVALIAGLDAEDSGTGAFGEAENSGFAH